MAPLYLAVFPLAFQLALRKVQRAVAVELAILELAFVLAACAGNDAPCESSSYIADVLLQGGAPTIRQLKGAVPIVSAKRLVAFILQDTR